MKFTFFVTNIFFYNLEHFFFYPKVIYVIYGFISLIYKFLFIFSWFDIFKKNK